jgi:hypothetical protein
MMLDQISNSTVGTAEARRLAQRLLPSPSEGEALIPSGLAVLFDQNEQLWARIATGLRNDWRGFDGFLRRVHYQREANFSNAERNAVLRFLTMAYRLTGDIRYFNEFLWFNGKSAHELAAVNLVTFKDNLRNGKHHLFPLASQEQARDVAEAQRPTPVSSVKVARTLRVALLGPPHAFIALYPRLEAAGFLPQIYNFPVGERRRLHRWLHSTRLSNLYFRARGCALPYRTVRVDPASPKVRSVLGEEQFDVAIHQLPFIIRSHLIESFSLGILNDHFGLLPYIRGRSSVEYSLLFGFPVSATMHFVDEGVDTGPILSTTTVQIDPDNYRTVTAVKDAVASGYVDRVVNTLTRLRAGATNTILNPQPEGLQFFTMHHELLSYVERTILPQLQSQRPKAPSR